jgi:4-amino-4-deoxy-L-arabinose transferase-like glycosyltransferase
MGGANSVAMRFSEIKLGANEPAKIAVSSCGGPEQEHTILSSSPIFVPTSWLCNPLQITLRSLNLSAPTTEGGGRLSAAKIDFLSVSSLITQRFAVVEWSLLLLLNGIVLALAALSAYVARGVGAAPLPTALAVVIAVFLLVFVIENDPNKLTPVIIATIGSLIGMALYTSQRVKATGVIAAPPISASGERGSKLLFLAALLVGAALRVYGIDFGLPSNFHPDEVPKVNAIMRMVDSGTFDPQYFLHPSLLLYLTYGANTLLHLSGLDGTFRESAFLAGRLVSATAGVTSIIFTYLIGQRLYSKRAGALAAFLLAVFPLHVTCSRYLKEDALLTCVVLSCVLTTIIAVQDSRRWLLIFAGILAGCTAGTKYSGILMVIVPLSAPWLASRKIKPDSSWIPWALLAAAISPLGFLATTPYAVLNSAKFIKDFSSESRHMQNGHTVTISAWSQLWMYHFWRSIWPGITGFVALLATIAGGFLLRRGRIQDLIVLGVALLFYLPAEYVKAKPAPQPERYILPCLPFIAIGVAELIASLRSLRWRFSSALATMAAILVVVLPFSRSAQLADEVRSDTRDRLAVWMRDNLPHGSKVLMDWKPYCPNFHGEYFEVQHIPRARIIQELDVAALRRSGADYLVISSLFYNRYFSQPEGEPILRQRFREVFQKVPVIMQVTSPSGGPYGFHNPTLTLFSLKDEDFKELELERVRKLRGEIAKTSNEVRAQARW